MASTTFPRMPLAGENIGASRVLAAVSRLTAIDEPEARAAASAPLMPPSCQHAGPVMSAHREEQPAGARFVPVVEAAVMGAGAWGTALAKVLADAGNDVTLWARRPELADEINDTHRNSGYLGDCRLARVDPGDQRCRRRAGRGLHRAAGGAVADAARQPRAVARRHRRRRHAGQRGQGHRTGHADADEPGDRTGHRCRSRAGRRGHRTQPGQRDRRRSNPPRPSSPAPTPGAR